MLLKSPSWSLPASSMVQDVSWVTPPSYCKYSRILYLQKSTVEVFEEVCCTYGILVTDDCRNSDTFWISETDSATNRESITILLVFA